MIAKVIIAHAIDCTVNSRRPVSIKPATRITLSSAKHCFLVRYLRKKSLSGSGIDQAAAPWFRDRVAELLRCVDPKPDRILGVREGGLLGIAVGGAPRQLGNLDDECFVIRTPEYDDPVLDLVSLRPTAAGCVNSLSKYYWVSLSLYSILTPST